MCFNCVKRLSKFSVKAGCTQRILATCSTCDPFRTVARALTHRTSAHILIKEYVSDDMDVCLCVQIPYTVTDEQLGSSWCCSDLRAWDAAHASCDVPQTLSDAEIDRVLTVRIVLCRRMFRIAGGVAQNLIYQPANATIEQSVT